ncbi:MAG TPA: hypothetical protein DDW89_09285, partial [Gammaproteobacteria bacterium]|nr:hypothetical protein [Gammaproteobacteria bacterium]
MLAAHAGSGGGHRAGGRPASSKGRIVKPADYDILLSEPDFSDLERQMVAAVMGSPYITAGPLTERLEAAVAERLGRRHALCLSSSTLAL